MYRTPGSLHLGFLMGKNQGHQTWPQNNGILHIKTPKSDPPIYGSSQITLLCGLHAAWAHPLLLTGERVEIPGAHAIRTQGGTGVFRLICGGVPSSMLPRMGTSCRADPFETIEKPLAGKGFLEVDSCSILLKPPTP